VKRSLRDYYRRYTVEQLTNVTIQRVYEGKTGTNTKPDGSSWDWTAYNFYLDGDRENRKFGYFQSGNKPVPLPGMNITLLEYDISQEGQYTNYKVSKMMLAQGAERTTSLAQTTQTRAQTEDRRDLSMYVSYAKDILIAKGGSDSLEQDCIDIANAGLRMWGIIHEVDSKAEPDVKDLTDNTQTPPGELEPLAEVPMGQFAIKVPVCPINANKGEPVSTVYCNSDSQRCDNVLTCAAFRAIMPQLTADHKPVEDDIPF